MVQRYTCVCCQGARQLRHLIVRDGKVVNQVFKNGKTNDSEIGLGGFLVDNDGRSTMNDEFWFLANRTAFGIRDDGNLVFAMGHHVGTKDLAKALALAGCKRAIHGDANIHNIVCNFYFRDENNKIIKRDRLSPEQLQYTMKRYDQGYAKDFSPSTRNSISHRWTGFLVNLFGGRFPVSKSSFDNGFLNTVHWSKFN